METEVREPWIYTYSGATVDLFNPDPETILLTDIAHALSNIGRWGGHTAFYWSVAQHSVLVSKVCDPKDAMAGLFHDAAEAYLGDICRPLKRTREFHAYREVYNYMERIIMTKFCGSADIPMSVKLADEAVLATEARALMGMVPNDPHRKEWLCNAEPLDVTLHLSEPEYARQGFLHRYYRIGALTGDPDETL